MSIGQAVGAVVAEPGQKIDVASLFSITSANNPQYLIVSLLDRDEYTDASNGNTGTLSDNGSTIGFTDIGGDADGVGIVYSWNAATGQYTNGKFGNLANLIYTASTSTNDNTNLSIFGANNLALANDYANNPFVLDQNPSYFAYEGSVSIVTEPTVAGGAPAQATPDSVCGAADSFIGQAWNMDGCWVLASDIAAEAGASLPLASTSLFIPGQANGEWIVAFNGPAGQSGNWQSMVHAGEVVVFATSSSSGHVTTVVSGSGSTAKLVDNITYVTQNETIVNSANDGSSNDIVIAAPHLASQEWAQAVAGSVVIYELDTPIVTDAAATVAVQANVVDPLSSLFTVADPIGRAISEYQFFATSSLGVAVASDFSVGGKVESAGSAAQAITVSAASLSGADFLSGGAAANDILDIRAFNGLYWGDWQTDAITVTAPPAPPVLSGGGNGVTYTPEGAPVAIDAALAIGDAAAASLAGATVSIGAGFSVGDILTFINQNGIAGSYAASTGVLTLSGAESLVDYQAALRSITFSSASGNPSNSATDLSRTVAWSVTDGTLTSNSVTSTIAVDSSIAVTNGQTMTVSSGEAVFGAVLSNGGTQVIASDGTATDTVVDSGGIEIVDAGGTTTGTTLNGGDVDIFGGTNSVTAGIGGGTVVFSRPRADYLVSSANGRQIVVTDLANPGSVTTLTGVANIDFSDWTMLATYEPVGAASGKLSADLWVTRLGAIVGAPNGGSVGDVTLLAQMSQSSVPATGAAPEAATHLVTEAAALFAAHTAS